MQCHLQVGVSSTTSIFVQVAWNPHLKRNGKGHTSSDGGAADALQPGQVPQKQQSQMQQPHRKELPAKRPQQAQHAVVDGVVAAAVDDARAATTPVGQPQSLGHGRSHAAKRKTVAGMAADATVAQQPAAHPVAADVSASAPGSNRSESSGTVAGNPHTAQVSRLCCWNFDVNLAKRYVCSWL